MVSFVASDIIKTSIQTKNKVCKKDHFLITDFILSEILSHLTDSIKESACKFSADSIFHNMPFSLYTLLFHDGQDGGRNHFLFLPE